MDLLQALAISIVTGIAYSLTIGFGVFSGLRMDAWWRRHQKAKYYR